jgi:hypothetical protein
VAILDTFYTLFKTNSDEIRKGYNDAEKATDKFTESMSRADAGVHAAGAKIVDTFKEVGATIAAAFAFEHVKEFIEATVELNAHLKETSERIGVDVEDLAALQSAATRFGGSAEGVTGTLDFLNRGLADIAVKGTSRLKPFFDELKINVLNGKGHVKDLQEVLGQLADKLAGKTVQERAGLGERFQLDPGLLLAMADGRRGLEDIIKRQKELGVTTEADAEAADKFEKKMADLRVQFQHVGNQIVGGLLPVLGKLVDGVMSFVGFLEKHKSLVEGFFIGIGGVIAVFYTPQVIKAAIATAGWLAEVLLIPALIAAAFAVFAFIFDDIKNFLEGNKSITGELAKRWPIVGEVIHDVANTVVGAWDWMMSILKGGETFFAGLGKLIGAALGALGREAVSVARAFAQAFPGIVAVFQGIGDKISWVIGLMEKLFGWIGRLGGSALKYLGEGLANAPKALSELGKLASNAADRIGPQPAYAGAGTVQAVRTAATEAAPAVKTVQAIQAGQKQVAAATATHLSSVTNNAITHGAQNTVTKKIEVKTGDITITTQATDGKQVVTALGDHLAEHVRKAIAQHDDGVAM